MEKDHPCFEVHDDLQVAYGNLGVASAKHFNNPKDPILEEAYNSALLKHKKASEALSNCLEEHGTPVS